MKSPGSSPRSAVHHGEIRTHIERHLGRIIGTFPDTGTATDSIIVHHVAASETRPFQTLITSGMSDEPMSVPASEPDAPRHLELMMTLPEHWTLGHESVATANYWPVAELLRLARLPRDSGSWLGWGHVVPHGVPPQPFAPDTRQCAVILAPSLLVKETFYQLDLGSKRIAFFSAIPLYREEAELKERQGMAILLGKLIDNDIRDVIQPGRRNVARRRFGFF